MIALARWQVTIKQPTGATPALPSIALEYFGGEGYSRGELQSLQVGDFSPASVPTLTGQTAVLYRFIWSLTVDLIESELLKLGALIRWQDRTYAAGNDGHLLLEDEVEYLDPEATPHSKNLITPIAWGEAVNHEYGFGRFKVKLQQSEDFRKQQGVLTDGSGTLLKLATLQAIELP